MSQDYVHGTSSSEQERLARLNEMTNAPYLDFLSISPGMTILEVGSGLGILTNAVASKNFGGEVIGLEYSPEQLAQAKVAHSNLSFVRGDAQQLPFVDNRFDLVYCRCVLEHLADPLRAVKEMQRVLKPGGRVAVLENNTPQQDFYPDCPKGAVMLKAFCETQSKLGGDAEIGKKLYFYLTSAGFERISLSIQPEIHAANQPTFVWWMQNMISIIESAAPQIERAGLATRQEIAEGLDELRGLVGRKDASCYFYWNRAAGFKP